ncbi:hypothetical protein MO3_01369, partial [Escherichia coli O104:H4 str. Ec11-9450]
MCQVSSPSPITLAPHFRTGPFLLIHSHFFVVLAVKPIHGNFHI